ncbi:hypothetical protein Tco_0832218 [Tanacetum coccineum]
MSVNCFAYELYWNTLSRNMNPVAAQQDAPDNALICPKLPNQYFVEPPSEDELVSFIKELGYSGKCDMLSAIYNDQMHQPWRTFIAIINRCISGKTTGLDRLRESRAQILWGIFYQKNVDYVALLWKDFMFQADNRDISPACKENMPYPRFKKVIINHFIFKDKTISMRNKINLHRAHDDSLLDIKNSNAYKTYLDYATGKVIPKKARKFKKVDSPSKKLSLVLEEEPAKTPKRAKKPAKQAETAKKPSTMKATSVLIKYTPALLEATQLKKAFKKRKQDTYKLQASGSSEGADFESEVPDEPKGKSTDISEGTDESDDVNDDDDNENDDDGDNDATDSEMADLDEDENPSLTLKDDEEEEYEEEYVHTLENYESVDDEENVDENEFKELYEEMTDAGRDDATQEKSYEQVVDDAHVIITVAHVTQKTKSSKQSSFVSSDFANQFLNLDNVPPSDHEFVSMMNVKVSQEVPSTQMPSLLISTPTPTPTTKQNTTLIPGLPDFSSLFGFVQRVSALEKELSQFEQVDHSAHLLETIKSQIPEIVDDPLSTRHGYAAKTALYTVTESLENVVLTQSSSQPKSTYEASTSLTEFELKKILLDKMQRRTDLGNTDDQANVETPSRSDWFKRPKRPSTPGPDWNARKSVDFKPPETWINKIAHAEKPPLTFQRANEHSDRLLSICHE